MLVPPQPNCFKRGVQCGCRGLKAVGVAAAERAAAAAAGSPAHFFFKRGFPGTPRRKAADFLVRRGPPRCDQVSVGARVHREPRSAPGHRQGACTRSLPGLMTL